MDIPGPSTRPAGPAGAETRPSGGKAAAAIGAGAVGAGAVNEFLNDRPGAGGERPNAGERRPGTALPADRQLAQNRPGRVENRQEYQQNRQTRRDEVQDQFRDNHPRFDWAVDHPHWAAWRVNRPYRWATAAALSGWCGYGASDAGYYDYGENVYYGDEGVYYGDAEQPVATAEEYTEQAEQIATTIPEAANPEWMPLGVFAVTEDGQATGAAPTMFVQLTVSKEGMIAGTFQNTTAGTSQPLEGMIDKKSQRAAWVISGKKRPIMETGIFNLTKDTASALVHFEDGQTQQRLLVRMDEPKDAEPMK